MAAGVAGIAPSASGEIGGTNEATAPTEPTPVSKNARSPDLRTRRLIIMSPCVSPATRLARGRLNAI
jgi:hypothetical protein